MITRKTKYPSNEKILKSGSKKYIPSEDIEELEYSIKRSQSSPSMDTDFGSHQGDHQFEMKEKDAKNLNRELDRTKTFSSAREKRETEVWR